MKIWNNEFTIPPKTNILAVDDTPEILRLLTKFLSSQGYDVRSALNGKLALDYVQETLPDLILLDIKMPDLSGFEVCDRLKADKRTRDIPVIFISGFNEVTDKVKGFALGGVDYITKPFQVEEVVARVATHLQLRRLQHQLQITNENLTKQLGESESLNVALRQRNAQLQEALGTIKTLNGLVPICAWCHKYIKDEEGCWMNLETYIQDHSEATFTHGICPSCLKRSRKEANLNP